MDQHNFYHIGTPRRRSLVSPLPRARGRGAGGEGLQGDLKPHLPHTYDISAIDAIWLARGFAHNGYHADDQDHQRQYDVERI